MPSPASQELFEKYIHLRQSYRYQWTKLRLESIWSLSALELQHLHQLLPVAAGLHLRFMYLTPHANDFRHQPPLKLLTFRNIRRRCSSNHQHTLTDG